MLEQTLKTQPKQLIDDALGEVSSKFQALDLFSDEMISTLHQLVTESFSELVAMAVPIDYISRHDLEDLEFDYMLLRLTTKYPSFNYEKVDDFMREYEIERKYKHDVAMLEKVWIEQFEEK